MLTSQQTSRAASLLNSDLSRTILSKPGRCLTKVPSERLSATADMRGKTRAQDVEQRRSRRLLALLLEQLLPGNLLIGDIGQFEQEIDNFVFE